MIMRNEDIAKTSQNVITRKINKCIYARYVDLNFENIRGLAQSACVWACVILILTSSVFGLKLLQRFKSNNFPNTVIPIEDKCLS